MKLSKLCIEVEKYAKYLDLKEVGGHFRKDMNKVQIDHALGIFKIVTLGNRTLFVKKTICKYNQMTKAHIRIIIKD